MTVKIIPNPKERRDFANRFKPAVKGKSDKFSWRFHKRMLKYGRESVYLMAWNFLDGKKEISLDDLKGFVSAARIAVGCKDGGDWLCGDTLSGICKEGGSTNGWAFGPMHNVAEWIDITDWFWTNYERHGRCMFFKHLHSWISINRNSRKCEWCGTHERREVETIKRIERRDKWSAIAPLDTHSNMS